MKTSSALMLALLGGIISWMGLFFVLEFLSNHVSWMLIISSICFAIIFVLIGMFHKKIDARYERKALERKLKK